MKKFPCALFFGALFVLISGPAFAQSKGDIHVEKPWARATLPGAAVGGGYLLIRNAGPGADRLVSLSSIAAARVEMHEMAMEKDVMRMREVKAVDVPAKGSVEFKPGGFHLMFMDLKAPFKQGEKVPVTLRFEKAGELKAEFVVEAAGAASAAGRRARPLNETLSAGSLRVGTPAATGAIFSRHSLSEAGRDPETQAVAPSVCCRSERRRS